MIIYKATNKYMPLSLAVHYIVADGYMVYVNGRFYYESIERIIESYIKFMSSLSIILHSKSTYNSCTKEIMIEFNDKEELIKLYPEYFI